MKKSREQMIVKLLDLIDDWELLALIDYAKHQMRQDLDNLTDKELSEEYNLEFDLKG